MSGVFFQTPNPEFPTEELGCKNAKSDKKMQNSGHERQNLRSKKKSQFNK